MALKAVLENLDSVEEGVKPFYTQRDGKFFLDVESTDGYELTDVSSLQGALSTERSARDQVERELKKFGSTWDKESKKWTHSIDPAKAKQALAKYDEFMQLDPAKEADKIAESKIRAVTEQLTEQFSGDLSSRDERIKHLSNYVSDLLIVQTATAEVLKQKGEPELLIPHIQKMTRVTEKDGKFFAEVLDKDGNVRIGDTKGNPMTIAQLVEEMRSSNVYGRAFEGDATSGTGKRPGLGGNPGTLKRSQMTPQQKREYQQKHGQAAYLQLPA